MNVTISAVFLVRIQISFSLFNKYSIVAVLSVFLYIFRQWYHGLHGWQLSMTAGGTEPESLPV